MKREERKSGIEMLKILALLAIILSHVVQTLGTNNTYINDCDYVLPLGMATTDIQMLILSILRYGGSFGNTVFFVCSCWFLLDSEKTSIKKILFMVIDIWCVSIIMLITVYAVCGGG